MINILKEIGIILRTHVASSEPAVLTLDNGDTITNPYEHAKAQMVYLVEYYFLEKMKFWDN